MVKGRQHPSSWTTDSLLLKGSGVQVPVMSRTSCSAGWGTGFGPREAEGHLVSSAHASAARLVVLVRL